MGLFVQCPWFADPSESLIVVFKGASRGFLSPYFGILRDTLSSTKRMSSTLLIGKSRLSQQLVKGDYTPKYVMSRRVWNRKPCISSPEA